MDAALSLSAERFLACHRLANAVLPPARLRALLAAAGGDPAAVLQLPDSRLRALGAFPRQIARLREAASAPVPADLLDGAERLGVQTILPGEPLYPQDLAPLDDAPGVLFLRGRLPAAPAVAVVGTRRASAYGRAQASRFARALAEAGIPVVSGGAAGIDTAAHLAALETGGATVAVVACGLDISYPAANRALFERIVAEGGAVLSEYPLGAGPEPWRFPARNRIIAGMTRLTALVETPEGSGALITARNAAEYGRDVWVVPGPVDSGRSRGGHRLIQDGAFLADSPEDLLDALGHGKPAAPRNLALPLETPEPTLSEDEARLREALGAEPRHLDEAAESAGLDGARAAVAATLLEMKRLVSRRPGNLFIRTG